MTSRQDTNLSLLDRICDLFQGMPTDDAALDELLLLYNEEVLFRDPIQSLRGKQAFREMNQRLLRRAREISFEVTDRAQRGDSLFLAWNMSFAARLGPPIAIEGTTHLRVQDGRVVYHRDYWDLLGSFMASVPLAGVVYRTLVAKLG